MSSKTVFQEIIGNKTTERINISQILSEKLKFSSVLAKIEFTSFEFCVNSIKDYSGVRFAILDIGLAKTRFKIWDENHFGIEYMVIQDESALPLNAKHMMKNLETPISKVDFYGLTLTDEKVDFYLDPNHYLDMNITISETNEEELLKLKQTVEDLNKFVDRMRD
jgi:hypothetical protein